jgi:hypothetical protein
MEGQAYEMASLDAGAAYFTLNKKPISEFLSRLVSTL